MPRRLGQLVWPGAPVGGLSPSSPATPAFGGGPAIQSVAPSPGTLATVAVLRADTLSPVQGALVRMLSVSHDGDEVQIAGGFTGSEGRIVFEAGPVPSTQVFRYRYVAEPGESGVSFPPASVEGAPNRTYTVTPTVCPYGTDSLVCDVGRKQVEFASVHGHYMREWSANRDLALRMAHAHIRDLPVSDSRLQQYVNYKSWGVADLGIPPTDWPEIVRNEAQMARVLESVPWPVFQGEAKKIGEYFQACAMGIGITEGVDGTGLAANNWRLYSPTWSDYFPRSDAQIRHDLAARWLININPVLQCITHRIKKKAREVERSAKAFSTMALTTSLILAPMLGPVAGPSVIITEAYTHLQLTQNLNVSESVEEGITKSGLLDATGAGAQGIRAAAISAFVIAYVAEKGTELNPAARAAIIELVPEVAEAAVEELLGGVGIGSEPVSGTISSTGSASAIALGTALAAVVVKVIAAQIRNQGLKEVAEFNAIVLGLRNLQAELIPFYIWCMKTIKLEKLYEQGAAEAGLDLDAERDIIGPLVEQAERAGVEVPAEAMNPEMADAGSPTEKALTIGAIGGGALALAFATGIL